MNTAKDDTKKIYNFIRQHTNGVALETLESQYQISQQNPAALISIAELLADGKIKQRGGMYCASVKLGATGGKKRKRRSTLRRKEHTSCKHMSVK